MIQNLLICVESTREFDARNPPPSVSVRTAAINLSGDDRIALFLDWG
jgi:hypothetical protein